MEDMNSKIVFKIDQREGKLKGMLAEAIQQDCIQGVQVILENLECADFIIEYDKEVVVAFERKTWKDLLASIKDGRYRIQKDKMLECIGRDKILYILEGANDWQGNGTGIYNTIDKKSVISSVINTQIRDGIRVVNTKSLDDTCVFLLHVIQRIAKDPHKYMKNNDVDNQPTHATKEDYICKHKVNSPNDMFFYQMTQVPGISSKTAMAFVNEFGTMKGMYETMSHLNQEEKLVRLTSITTDDNGKKRRINSKVGENVLKYMF
jgi:ERCC4-type nuclease